MAKDWYKILEIDSSADQEQIKSAYRRLAKKYHPDLNPDPKTADSFREITEAYQSLTNKSGGSEPEMDLGDIWSTFFRKQKQRFFVDVNFTFMESVKGCNKNIHIDTYISCDSCGGNGGELGTCGTCKGSGKHTHRQGSFIMNSPCPSCKGSGRNISKKCQTCSGLGVKVEKKEISFIFPEGISDGMSILVFSDSEAEYFATAIVEPHPLFLRDGNNIILELYVKYSTLVLGGVVDLECIDEKISLKIPEMKSPGSKLRLIGKGVRGVNTKEKGDMIVILYLKMPENISKKERKFLMNSDL